MDVNIFDVTEDSDKKIFPSPAVSKIRQGYFGKKNDEYGRTVQKPNIKSYIVRFFPLRVHVYKREYLRANMSKNPRNNSSKFNALQAATFNFLFIFLLINNVIDEA